MHNKMVKTLSFGCGCLWLWVILQLCLGIAAGLVMVFTGPSEGFVYVLAEIPLVVCLILATLSYGKIQWKRPVHFWPVAGEGLAVGLFFSTAWSFLLSILQTDAGNVDISLSQGGQFWTVLVVGLVGPVLEELFFRGFLYRQLARYNWVFAAVVSGVLFGLIHLNIGQGVFACVFGLILAWSYHRTGSLVTPVFLHIANNCLALFASRVWWGSFLMLGGAVAGIIVLAAKVPALSAALKANKKEAAFYGSQIFDSPWIWSFLVMSAIVSFALSV